MYPGFMHWWKEAQRQHHGHHGGYEASAGCGPGGGGRRHGARRDGDEGVSFVAGEDGGGFGVRRPLRFMAWKLDLEEGQVEKLAAILDELKTERAQAAVDYRRSVGVFADAIGGDSFDAAAAEKAAQTRVATAEKLRDAVVKALGKTHAMLNPEQRKALAYLLRSGQLTI